jgi:hypothetical protein
MQCKKVQRHRNIRIKKFHFLTQREAAPISSVCTLDLLYYIKHTCTGSEYLD